MPADIKALNVKSDGPVFVLSEQCRPFTLRDLMTDVRKLSARARAAYAFLHDFLISGLEVCVGGKECMTFERFAQAGAHSEEELRFMLEGYSEMVKALPILKKDSRGFVSRVSYAETTNILLPLAQSAERKGKDWLPMLSLRILYELHCLANKCDAVALPDILYANEATKGTIMAAVMTKELLGYGREMDREGSRHGLIVPCFKDANALFKTLVERMRPIELTNFGLSISYLLAETNVLSEVPIADSRFSIRGDFILKAEREAVIIELEPLRALSDCYAEYLEKENFPGYQDWDARDKLAESEYADSQIALEKSISNVLLKLEGEDGRALRRAVGYAGYVATLLAKMQTNERQALVDRVGREKSPDIFKAYEETISRYAHPVAEYYRANEAGEDNLDRTLAEEGHPVTRETRERMGAVFEAWNEKLE